MGIINYTVIVPALGTFMRALTQLARARKQHIVHGVNKVK